ncbi:RNA polymerase II transcription elongation factor-domain-containing protein [Durotheca rogersii]|uniref:RNA polymerase II transcription elongation factor-domain-containing protein n=1 Tax=Durotheca rogersii TaxID=419775 RepID=UPI00221FA4F2|nr:RNA polymerase II transcription elongation factor-domain-containing protein [Durotheca rogersii]KAI5867769.1 RNA polymerase II transcription elongation factor-domain-containing protein [Durotheca rogersii]
MTSLAAGIVDPTKAGKYPVVLSDALLGKDPKELFTGVRYNHKPPLSSSTAPAQARIKPAPSTSKKGAPSYDLAFQDDGGRYQYKGTSGAEKSQYVLIFDPAREVFVLHKVNSMFNMNLVRTPSNDNAESLRREFPHLEAHSSSTSAKAAASAGGSKSAAKGGNDQKKTAAKSRKQAAPPVEEKPRLAMPEKKAPPPPPKPAANNKRRQASEEEDEESSDDDLGLTIENPGGEAPSTNRDFSPIFGIRRFSDFVQQNGEDDQDDADAEEDDDDAFEHFKLPSPINHQMPNAAPHIQANAEEEEEEDEEDDNMEDVQHEQPAEAEEDPGQEDIDLEAELMAALEEESDVSEEE